jgi:hypothetical protein
MSPRALLAIVAAATAAVVAQDTPPVKGADEQLLESVRVVADRIAGIVHVDHPRSIVAVRADQAARAAESAARARRTLPAAVASARGRAWRDLGLGSGTEAADLVAAIENDLAGMTFDAARERLLVDPQRLHPGGDPGDPRIDAEASVLLATGVAADEPVAGHYVAHALLDTPASEVPTTDALLARSALAEGTSNLAAMVLLFGGVGLESEVFTGTLRPEDVLSGRLVPESLRGASPVVSHLLEFVYLDGFAQSAAIARQGGFNRLAQERRRRLTTRDVLHLDRQPAPAADIPEPAVAASLGLAPADRDTLGEQGIISLVSLLTGKDNLGLIAGDGWVGDGLWRFEGPGSGGLTIWITRWKTPEELDDFSYALERSLSARFPGETLRDDPVRGGHVLARADRVYRIERRSGDLWFEVANPEIDAKIGPPAKKKVPEAPRPKPK